MKKIYANFARNDRKTNQRPCSRTRQVNSAALTIQHVKIDHSTCFVRVDFDTTRLQRLYYRVRVVRQICSKISPLIKYT